MTYRQWLKLRSLEARTGADARTIALPSRREGRLLLAALVVVAIAALILAPRLGWAADTKVKVLVNGCPKDFTGIARNGVQYVPLGKTVGAVGAKMKWDAPNSQGHITLGPKHAVVKKSQGIMVGGALYVPLKVVGPALNCRVTWDGAGKSVRIETIKAAPVPT